METTYLYVGLSSVLSILLWLPYISARIFIWGIPTFLHNYPPEYPRKEPEEPLWVSRSKSAHMNMIEILPAFLGVVFVANHFAESSFTMWESIAFWSEVFFWSRLLHAVVYTLGIPFLRTPVYLVSWFSILAYSITIFIVNNSIYTH